MPASIISEIHATYLEKYIPVKNVARFYRLAVLPNLFGEWGRIGQGGRVRLDCFATHDQALAVLLVLEAASGNQAIRLSRSN